MKKKEKHSFGIKGWWTIIFCGLLYYMMTGTSADGLNVMVPGFCELKGWDYSTLLSFSTIAGLVGMIIAFLTARLITKKGAKFYPVLSLVQHSFYMDIHLLWQCIWLRFVLPVVLRMYTVFRQPVRSLQNGSRENVESLWDM